MVSEVSLRHADPVVLNGEGFGVLLDRNPYRERRGCKRRIGDRLVTQLLASVGGVGKEFAKKNIPIGIDRMHHQVQQFSNICLKSLALTRCVRHCEEAFLPVAIAFHEFGGATRSRQTSRHHPRSADIAFAPGGCKAFAISVPYSRTAQEFAAGQAGPDTCW